MEPTPASLCGQVTSLESLIPLQFTTGHRDSRRPSVCSKGSLANGRPWSRPPRRRSDSTTPPLSRLRSADDPRAVLDSQAATTKARLQQQFHFLESPHLLIDLRDLSLGERAPT